MKKYDFVVLGGGSGMIVAQNALLHNLKVAVVHKPPVGGTCQNFGCIPSKMLIFPADMITEIQEANKLGIFVEIQKIDFAAIMDRMKKLRADEQEREKKNLRDIKNFDYYIGEGHFIKEYVVEINDQQIQGKKFVICTGARPLIPPIKGIDKRVIIKPKANKPFNFIN